MRPAPPAPRERGAHPTARGRRARPALAPGGAHNRARLSPPAGQRRSRGQRSLSFPARTSPSPAQASGRQKRSSGQRDAGSPHRLPAAPTPGQEPMRPEAEAVACASVRATGASERGQGLPCLQGRRQPEQELGAQMTGRSCQRGGGRLRVFVLGEEAERPITQFVYSTQTQFVTGWLCLGGGMLTWSNLRSQLGDINVAEIL